MLARTHTHTHTHKTLQFRAIFYAVNDWITLFWHPVNVYLANLNGSKPAVDKEKQKSRKVNKRCYEMWSREIFLSYAWFQASAAT